MTKIEIANMLKEAFESGYYSYLSPCCAYNTLEDAWEKSDIKVIYDQLTS